MKIITPIVITSLITILLSCNLNPSGLKQPALTDSLHTNTAEVSYDRTENLTLVNTDTIKKTAYFFFSNQQTKDLFLLTIEPGLVKNSKSSLQILTTSNKVVYKQTFDTDYFIKLIYEPDSIPTTGGQEEYDKYMEHYWKSITPKQYEACFNKSVNSFFNAIYPIAKDKYADLKNWGVEINDQDFFKEIFADTTIQLIDVSCFDCSEGGAIIGYSKKQNKLVTLLEHD